MNIKNIRSYFDKIFKTPSYFASIPFFFLFSDTKDIINKCFNLFLVWGAIFGI